MDEQRQYNFSRGKKPPPRWNSETARAASLKGKAARKARENDLLFREANAILSSPLVPEDPARLLLPTILADEITFRSELLDRNRRLERMLLKALDEGAYAAGKDGLAALAKQYRDTLEFSLKMVEASKHLDIGDAKTSQVSGLVSRYAILRAECMKRGLTDKEGNIIERPTKQVGAGTPSEAAPPVEGEGVS